MIEGHASSRGSVGYCDDSCLLSVYTYLLSIMDTVVYY